jgi:hypothetical protein
MTHNINRLTVRFLVVALMSLGLTVTGFGASQFSQVSRVEAFDTDTWTLWASAGSRRIVVDGDGDTDLDCYVYDLSGRLLAKDDDGTDYCILDFYRRRGGDVEVRIVNLGSVWNRYVLRVD